jgi:hypothetical protein
MTGVALGLLPGQTLSQTPILLLEGAAVTTSLCLPSEGKTIIPFGVPQSEKGDLVYLSTK